MDRPWFKSAGWLHWPVSIPGSLAYLITVALCVNVVVDIDQRAHSSSDTLYGVFALFACSFLLLDWLARNSNGTRRGAP